MFLNRANSYISARCTVKRQLLSLKYCKTYHVHLHYTYRRREFFQDTVHLSCFSAEAYSEPLKTWSVFACPFNDFKPLTVCAKTLHLRCFRRFRRFVLQDTSLRICSKQVVPAICKPRHRNRGIGIGIGTITNVIISSSIKPMDPKLSRVVTLDEKTPPKKSRDSSILWSREK